MQGTSTKVTATGFAAWITICVFYVLFTASWGPLWAAPPAEVTVAFTGLIGFMAGWIVPEKAFNPDQPNNTILT